MTIKVLICVSERKIPLGKQFTFAETCNMNQSKSKGITTTFYY